MANTHRSKMSLLSFQFYSPFQDGDGFYNVSKHKFAEVEFKK